MLSILSYVSEPSICPPWRSVWSASLPIFYWLVCLPGVEPCEFFVYFGDQTLVWGIIGKYIFPYGWFPFHFADVFFSWSEAFYFDEVLFVYSFLYVPCSKRHIGEILLCGILEIFLSIFSSKTLMVLQIILQSFIHLELIFVYSVSWWPSLTFFFFACSCPDLSKPFVEEAIFTPFYAFVPFVKY